MGGGSARAAMCGIVCAACPTARSALRKGIAAGVFVSFTPLFGFHLIVAAGIALVCARAMILAALLGTFFGNPFTFPLILVSAMETGSLILGRGHMATPGGS